MKITKFSEIAKGPMFDHKDIMGLGDSNLNDEFWVENKENEVKNKMDNGASNLINKNFNLKNKLFLQSEKIKNSGNDYFSRTNMDKQKIFGDINKFKNSFGDKKMVKNNYGNTVNQLLGTGTEKGSWLMGTSKKTKNEDKSNMLFGIPSIKSENKSNMLFGTSPKINTQNKSNMLFDMKKNVSFVSKLDEFLGKKSFKGVKEKQDRAMSFMINNPFGMAKGRVDIQKKLNMFGDYDGDGLVNILDCNPINKKKQAFIHEIIGAKYPEDYNESKIQNEEIKEDAYPEKTDRDILVEATAMEEAQDLGEDVYKSVAERDLEKLQKLGIAVKKGISNFGTGIATGISNVGKGLGIIKTPEERIEYEKLKLQKEKELMPLRVQQMKLEQERLRTSPQSTSSRVINAPRNAVGTMQQALGATPMFSSRGPPGYPSMPGIDYSINKIKEMSSLSSSPMGGFEWTIRNLSKSDGSGLSSSIAPQLPTAPNIPQQSYQTYQSYNRPVSQPINNAPSYDSGSERIVSGIRYIRTADGRWQNTKTGDTVTYPRGSYKKSQRVVYVQQQPQ